MNESTGLAGAATIIALLLALLPILACLAIFSIRRQTEAISQQLETLIVMMREQAKHGARQPPG